MKLMEYHKFQIFFCREQDIYDDVDYADGKFPFLYNKIQSDWAFVICNWSASIKAHFLSLFCFRCLRQRFSVTWLLKCIKLNIQERKGNKQTKHFLALSNYNQKLDARKSSKDRICLDTDALFDCTNFRNVLKSHRFVEFL